MSDNRSAFPIPHCPTETSHTCESGMSLRDYFAAAALVGIWSCPKNILFDAGMDKSASLDELAEMSYAMADAMLAARLHAASAGGGK